jgi:hypothetical protein
MNEFVCSIKVIKEPMFLTFLLCKGQGVSYWLKWGDFIDKFWSLSEHYNWIFRSMLNAYVVLAKALIMGPSAPWSTLCENDCLTNFEVFRNITIGHFGACLAHMRYSLKPWSWNLLARFAHLYFVKTRPHGWRFAKTTGCRH